jgi:hypothetical protein
MTDFMAKTEGKYLQEMVSHWKYQNSACVVCIDAAHLTLLSTHVFCWSLKLGLGGSIVKD